MSIVLSREAVQVLLSMPDTDIYQPGSRRSMKRRLVRGADYCVHEWGDPGAPTLFYLHGWGDSGATFQFVVDALSADWHVVAPDWRGFGRSTADCECYWFPDYLADLHELLEHYSPGEPARLVGHSMGANAASLYAGAMPKRVGSFVNIEGFGLPDSDPDNAPRRYRLWMAAPRSAFSEYDSMEALASRIRQRSPGMSEGQALFVAGEWAETGEDGKVRLRADPRHKLPNPVLYRRAEAEACWRAIEADVLLITGGRSKLAMELGGVFGKMYPGAQDVRLEDAGHMLHFEAPAALATSIEDFLRQTL